MRVTNVFHRLSHCVRLLSVQVPTGVSRWHSCLCWMTQLVMSRFFFSKTGLWKTDKNCFYGARDTQGGLSLLCWREYCFHWILFARKINFNSGIEWWWELLPRWLWVTQGVTWLHWPIDLKRFSVIRWNRFKEMVHSFQISLVVMTFSCRAMALRVYSKCGHTKPTWTGSQPSSSYCKAPIGCQHSH